MLFGDAPLPSSNSHGSFSMFGDSSSISSNNPRTPQLSADDSKEILPSKEDVMKWSQAGGRVNNLRALLSSMHTVLWPGSGWKPVSLAELVDVQQVKDVKKNVKIPVLVGSGCTTDNVSHYLMEADALIVGSFFKEGGYWENPVSRERVQGFMDRVKELKRA